MSGPAASWLRIGASIALLALASAGPLWAQDAAPAQGPAILVVDQSRLFAESAFGRASITREEAAARELEAENSRIQAELVAEEQELTFLRQSLSAEDFTARAEAFDQKVERIRAEQDAKVRDLSRRREEDAKAFFTAILPILDDILQDRGAEAMLDKSVAILTLQSADITDEAIARIDLVLDTPAATAP